MYGGDEISSLVFDIGTFNSRFGYSGEDTPKYVFQTQVGISSSQSQQSQDIKSKNFIGETELRYFRPGIKVVNPMNNQGYIENQDEFEMLLNHVYSSCLKIESKENPVLFSEPGIHNKDNRTFLSQLMFEKFGTPAMFISKTPVLSAFSCGRSTCLVFDSGASSTYATPVHDGYVLQKTQIKYDIGGDYISNELSKVLFNKNIRLTPHYRFEKEILENGSFKTNFLDENLFSGVDKSYEQFWMKEIVREMKESSLSISEESVLGKELNLKPTNYELPDGCNVDLNEERLTILESLFNTNKDIAGFNGFHSMIIDAINKGDVDIKKEMFSNIFVAGGNTLFAGFPERLQRQLINFAPSNVKIKVLTHPSPSERRFSSWIGGSILSSLGTFHQMWFSKQEYEEHGASLIERKCV